MEISVWDTYVVRKDGKIMHFDILVNSKLKDENQILKFGKEYLKSLQQENQKLTLNECKFCHVEQAPKAIEEQVLTNGYSIIEIENCF